jgi:RimJ/RimL family protein N-acetyltransferase
MHLVPYDPAVRPSLPVAPGWPHPDTADALSFADRGGWTWLVVDDDGRVAGECGVKAPPDAAGVVEIGYGLAAPSRGRGLGRRAVAALVAELRGRPGVRRLEAEVHVGNVASRRVLEANGFTLDEVDGAAARYGLDVSTAV